MTTVVISQPMFFPWVGMLEQLRLADVYVHYDDVQFSKGSFTNRVQIKTGKGSKWMTVPLPGLQLGQNINQVIPGPVGEWGQSHVSMLEQAYREAPHVGEMLDLVRSVYARPFANLAELCIASMDAVWSYLAIAKPVRFLKSSELGIPGESDDRVLAVVKHVGGDCYVTGHGAKNYLDHERFEAQGVRVEYINYKKTPYPQLHGPFTPYVSVLDLIANRGREGASVIGSGTLYWKDFLSTLSDKEQA